MLVVQSKKTKKTKKKTDYNTKFTQIERKVTDHIYDKYVTTPEFKMFTAKVFHSRLKQVNLTTKTDFDNKLINLNIKKINLNKTKHLLVENELKKLQTFDSIYFRGKCHFEEDATQKYLVFQPMRKCFKTISNTDYVLFQNGRLKDSLTKVLNLSLRLIFFLTIYLTIWVIK